MALKNATIAIVDDDPDVLTAVRLLLKTEVKQVLTEKNPENLLSLLKENQVDLLFLDMNFKSKVNTGNEGLFWLQKVRKLYPGLPVVMITAYADIDLAVNSLKLGAQDFMVKPWQNQKLLETVKSNYQKNSQDRAPFDGPAGIIGQSPAMKNVFRKIEKIAPTDANILILGENGTGKDLIARTIHDQSLRRTHPYVKVDVGALTESLFESELFGHKKGAFTDAREDRQGRFQAANKGTLFLDEIGNITLAQQSRLLTALQNRYITPLGTNDKVHVDIRLICATNLPLSSLADESRFRRDLIYRINTVEITIPPLRERGEDIERIAEHYARLYAQKYGKPTLDFSREARKKLSKYSYPGNVRELQYAIERAIIMTENEAIEAEDILFSPIEHVEEPLAARDKAVNLSQVEKNAILNAISKHEGNISKAAKELGITRAALYRRISKYDI
jgi:DNA-binding NtrC family response regulator